jgi:uncharacterized damage-inducible protein DinB
MLDQILNTWRIHNHMNLLLLNELDEKALDARPVAKRQGRNVAQQFAHMHNVRYYHLENHAKKYLGKLKLIDSGKALNKNLLIGSLKESASAIEKLLSDITEGKVTVKHYKSGIRLLGYLISHESHHRGLIVISLKQSGIKLTNPMKYGIWEWFKDIDK